MVTHVDGSREESRQRKHCIEDSVGSIGQLRILGSTAKRLEHFNRIDIPCTETTDGGEHSGRAEGDEADHHHLGPGTIVCRKLVPIHSFPDAAHSDSHRTGPMHVPASLAARLVVKLSTVMSVRFA